MISYSIFPSRNGFKFKFNSSEKFWFNFDYVAICKGGKILYGNQKGYHSGTVDWYGVALDEIVMFIGLTNFALNASQKVIQRKKLLSSKRPLRNTKSNKDDFSVDSYGEYLMEQQYMTEYDQYIDNYNFNPYSIGGDSYEPYLEKY